MDNTPNGVEFQCACDKLTGYALNNSLVVISKCNLICEKISCFQREVVKMYIQCSACDIIALMSQDYKNCHSTIINKPNTQLENCSIDKYQLKYGSESSSTQCRRFNTCQWGRLFIFVTHRSHLCAKEGNSRESFLLFDVLGLVVDLEKPEILAHLNCGCHQCSRSDSLPFNVCQLSLDNEKAKFNLDIVVPVAFTVSGALISLYNILVPGNGYFIQLPSTRTSYVLHGNSKTGLKSTAKYGGRQLLILPTDSKVTRIVCPHKLLSLHPFEKFLFDYCVMKAKDSNEIEQILNISEVFNNE